MEYPGYGLSAAAEPIEASVYRHAEIALEYLRETLGVENSQTLLLGESLGAGVAVAMASRGYGARMILLSPFTSMEALAEHHAPWLPVGWVLRNRYDNASKALRISIPVLVIHGDADALIPARMGQQLAGVFPRAEFVTLPGVGHGAIIDRHGEAVLQHVRDWMMR